MKQGRDSKKWKPGDARTKEDATEEGVGGVILKRFERPDEVREFPRGRFEIVRVGRMTIGRASYEPGWRWKEHVGPASGTPTCQVEHVGIVLSGRCAVKMDRGAKHILKAGDLFHVAPGHDSWVVGKEPYVSLHFLGADAYAVERRSRAMGKRAVTGRRRTGKSGRE